MGPVGTNDDDPTERVLVRLAGWGAATADVRGVIVIGSRARTSDHPADPWSDADIVLATSAPRRYVADGGWVSALGDPWLTYVETAPNGGGGEQGHQCLHVGCVPRVPARRRDARRQDAQTTGTTREPRPASSVRLQPPGDRGRRTGVVAAAMSRLDGRREVAAE